MKTFLSFQKLTRLKIHILLPNPDLSRLTRKLFEELQEGGIENTLRTCAILMGYPKRKLAMPHEAASMAEDGYKEGDVLMEGVRDGEERAFGVGRVQPVEELKVLETMFAARC